MTRRQIEPDLYYHTEIVGHLTPTDMEELRDKLLYFARISFSDIYRGDIAFEVVIEDGSLKIRVMATVGAVLWFLSQYGDIRSGADYLYHDLRAGYSVLSDHIERLNIGHPIAVQRRVGVIGRIDQTLHAYQNHRISEQECVRKLVELFAIINESPQKMEIIKALVEYIDKKYGNTFPWDDLERKLNRDVALPPRRKEEDEE